MFDSLQILVGKGRGDTGAFHRALDLARQLCAVDKWNGQGRLMIHHAYELHTRISMTEGHYDATVNAVVHEGIKGLEEGKDYEILPLPENFWEMHQVEPPQRSNRATSR